MSKKQFVFMGDIVGSEEYEQSDLQREFARLCKSINQQHKTSLISPLTITLGDEFQGIASDLSSGMNLILQMERMRISSALNFKIRYVLYYGEISTDINKKIAYGMLGPGLSKARQILEDSKSQHARFATDVQNQQINDAFANAFSVYQTITDQWNISRDAELIASLIKWGDYKIVAEKMNKTRSIIWKREKSLMIKEFFAIEKLINFIAQRH